MAAYYVIFRAFEIQTQEDKVVRLLWLNDQMGSLLGRSSVPHSSRAGRRHPGLLMSIGGLGRTTMASTVEGNWNISHFVRAADEGTHSTHHRRWPADLRRRCRRARQAETVDFAVDAIVHRVDSRYRHFTHDTNSTDVNYDRRRYVTITWKPNWKVSRPGWSRCAQRHRQIAARHNIRVGGRLR